MFTDIIPMNRHLLVDIWSDDYMKDLLPSFSCKSCEKNSRCAIFEASHPESLLGPNVWCDDWFFDEAWQASQDGNGSLCVSCDLLSCCDGKPKVEDETTERQRKQSAPKKTIGQLVDELSKPSVNQHLLIVPHDYDDPLNTSIEKVQPFQVKVHPQVSFLVDVHSHMSDSEVIGLLAGIWDGTERVLYIQAAFPCTATDRPDDGATDVELDPVAEWKVRNTIDQMGLLVVGWYHSHPKFKSDPSVTDIHNQEQYQQLMRDSKSDVEPFVGLIVSTYDNSLPSSVSHHQWFHVREVPDTNRSKKVSIPMKINVIQRSFKPQKLMTLEAFQTNNTSLELPSREENNSLQPCQDSLEKVELEECIPILPLSLENAEPVLSTPLESFDPVSRSIPLLSGGGGSSYLVMDDDSSVSQHLPRKRQSMCIDFGVYGLADESEDSDSDYDHEKKKKAKPSKKERHHVNKDKEASSSPTKRSRGRPKLSSDLKTTDESTTSSTSSTSSSDPNQSIQGAQEITSPADVEKIGISGEKRCRGRPRKISSVKDVDQKDEREEQSSPSSTCLNGDLEEIAVKKGRGRPRKIVPSSVEDTSNQMMEGQPIAKKPRGRPCKTKDKLNMEDDCEINNDNNRTTTTLPKMKKDRERDIHSIVRLDLILKTQKGRGRPKKGNSSVKEAPKHVVSVIKSSSNSNNKSNNKKKSNNNNNNKSKLSATDKTNTVSSMKKNNSNADKNSNIPCSSSGSFTSSSSIKRTSNRQSTMLERRPTLCLFQILDNDSLEYKKLGRAFFRRDDAPGFSRWLWISLVALGLYYSLYSRRVNFLNGKWKGKPKLIKFFQSCEFWMSRLPLPPWLQQKIRQEYKQYLISCWKAFET